MRSIQNHSLIRIAILGFAISAGAASKMEYAPMAAEYSMNRFRLTNGGLTMDARNGTPLPVSGNMPLVTVGTLPAGTKSPMNESAMDQAYYASFHDDQVGRDNVEDDNAANFALGKLELLPAKAESEIIIAVATPNLPQTSATIGPVVQDGDKLVLPIDIWLPDDRERSSTFNGRKVQLVYLPPLPAGKYKLQVQWRTMMPPRYGDGSDYSWTDLKTAELAFTVLAEDGDPGPNAAAPALPFAALQPAISLPPSDVKIQPAWWVSARRFHYNPAITESLTVGCCNDPLAAFQGNVSDVQSWAALPKFTHPDAEETLEAMVICPAMNTGEWASISAIHWKGTTAIIDADLWTDSEIRPENQTTIPVLLADLDPPAHRPALVPIVPPGYYKIEVRMRRLRANRPGGWYLPVSEHALRTQFDVK